MSDSDSAKWKAIVMREQSEESLRRCIIANLKTYDRLSQTGQPLDDDDRLLIRKVVLVALGNAMMGDT